MLFKNNKKKEHKLNQQRLEYVLKIAGRLLERNKETDVRKHPIYGLIKILMGYQLYDLTKDLCEGEDVATVDCIYRDLGIWLDGFGTDKYVESIEDNIGELQTNLATDVVILQAWNDARLTNALSNIGTNVENPFVYDEKNHFASYIYPLGITIIDNGNHSILSGVLKGEGLIYPNQIYDITEQYELAYFDGTSYREKDTNKIIQEVGRFELGAVFEIGRLLVEKGIRQGELS